jgi:hypothetical protein
MRPSAVHFCYNDIRLLPLMSMYQQSIGTHGRVRFRAHFGSHTECQYALMSFGIMPASLPVDTEGNKSSISLNQWIEKQQILEDSIFLHRSLLEFELTHGSPEVISQLEFELSKIKKKPAYDKAKFLWPTSVTDPVFCLQFLRAAEFNPYKAAQLLLESLPCVDDGNLGLTDLMEWLEKRKEELQVVQKTASSSLDDADVIHFPSVTDILLGRGFGSQNFPGNQHFFTFVKMHQGIYDEAGTDQLKKTAISKKVVHTLQESGARFLQRAVVEEDGWVHVEDEVAREKVSMAFRNIRRRK